MDELLWRSGPITGDGGVVPGLIFPSKKWRTCHRCACMDATLDFRGQRIDHILCLNSDQDVMHGRLSRQYWAALQCLRSSTPRMLRAEPGCRSVGSHNFPFVAVAGKYALAES